MIFHENHLLLADDSHDISYLISSENKMLQNLTFASVVIGALRVKLCTTLIPFFLIKLTCKPSLSLSLP